MKDEEPTGIMEGDILTEESSPKEEKQEPPKPQPASEQEVKPQQKVDEKNTKNDVKKGFFKKLKAPKPITYLILVGILIVVSIGLTLLSAKPKEQNTPIITQNNTEINSPTPTPKPGNEDLKKRVQDYDNNIDQLSSKPRTYDPPNIDLNMNFDPQKSIY